LRDLVGRTTNNLVEIGNILRTVKEHCRGKLNEGVFRAWVEATCGFSFRAGQRYMQLAAFLEGKNDTVALLPPTILYALSAKSTPPEVVTDVMARLDRGEKIDEDSIKTFKTIARCEQKRDKKQADRNFKRSKAWKQKIAASEAKAKERELAARYRAQVLLDEMIAAHGTKALIDITSAVNAEIYFLDVARKLVASAETVPGQATNVLHWSTPTIVPTTDVLTLAGAIIEPPIAEVAA
jgi:hypothetical protein